MKENKKSAFTIAELILTTVIMAVVCVIAPMVILKRDVKPAVAKKFDFIVKCASKCIYDAHTSTMLAPVTSTNNYASLDYNKNSNEFYTIELIGGGGSGTQKSVGYPGESKTIYLPSLDENIAVTNSDNKSNTAMYGGELTGYYLMVAGNGKGDDHSGNPSVLCAISEKLANQVKNGQKSLDNISCSADGTLQIASAKGGITSNEEIKTDKQEQRKEAEELSKPKIRYLFKTVGNSEKYFGQGGAKGSGNSGYKGIVIIK